MKFQFGKIFGRKWSATSRNLPHAATNQRGMSEHQRMLVHAVMQTDAAVMIANSLGIIQFVNPAFERNSGYSAGELVGQSPGLLKSGEHPPEFYAALWKTIKNGKAFRAVLTNRRKNGQIYFEERTITPIRDAGVAITHFVSTGHDVTSRAVADERLDYLANHDALTGLPNRSRFMKRVGQSIGRSLRDEKTFSLLLIDLDRFKRINDALGNITGDKLLVAVAARIGEVVGEQGVVARLGGDEFTVTIENPESAPTANRVAEALIAAFAQQFEIEGRVLYIGTSIGIATYPDDGADTESLVRHADVAMYHAKLLGRGTWVNFSSVMEGQMLEDLAIEVSLRSALRNAEFEIYYQPIISPDDRRILAVEALLRWHSPQHGEVPPGRFIPMLEETGLIATVGRWVLETACAQIMAIGQQSRAPVVLAVNISGRQFRDGNLIRDIQAVLLESGLPPEQLELEITESILIEDASLAGRTLMGLAALGVRLAIDDFGTGYSSLSYLRRFPINTLKIDRSFVIEMESCPDAVTIVKTIISLADNLGLDVVAEGVETSGQLAQLSAFGCTKVQGYWFSRPIPLADLTVLLKNACSKTDCIRQGHQS